MRGNLSSRPGMYHVLACCCVVLWASAGVATKSALHRCPPFWFSFARMLVAGLVTLGLAYLAGLPWPKKKSTWLSLAATGSLLHGIHVGLATWAMEGLSIGIAGMLSCFSSILLALGGVFLFGETMTRLTTFGLFATTLGVLTVMSNHIGHHNQPWALMMTFLAQWVLVAGNLLFKRSPNQVPLLVSHGIQMVVGALTLLPAALWFEWQAPITLDHHFLWAFIHMVVVVSMIAMLVWMWLIRTGSLGKAGIYLSLTPIVSLVFGAYGFGEVFSWLDVLGATMVGLGIALVQWGQAEHPPQQTPPPSNLRFQAKPDKILNPP